MSSQHHQQQPAAPGVHGGAHRRKGANPTRRTSTSDGTAIQQVPSSLSGGSRPPDRQPSADSDGSVSDDSYEDSDDDDVENQHGAGGVAGRAAGDGGTASGRGAVR